MTEEKRFLGHARVKNEGDPTRFDEGNTYGNYRPRGERQSMREEDLKSVWLSEKRWHVVRDPMCSYDIDDDEARVWTVSLTPGEPGWDTDGGYSGYGLKYSAARELADAANMVDGLKLRD